MQFHRVVKIFWITALSCAVVSICAVSFFFIIQPQAPPITFPDGKKFGFSIFDDTDGAKLERIKPVYEYLHTLGIKTTKSVWALPQNVSTGFEDSGDTLENPEYVTYLQWLQQNGFEIAYHSARAVSSTRIQQEKALNLYFEKLGAYPSILVHHSNNRDNLYWGGDRLNNFILKAFYNLQMPENKGRFLGHIPGTEYFWGDIAEKRVTYVRNFVFNEINTYKINPSMPYHDPTKPYVKYWFSSAAASGVQSFNALISSDNLDQLEREGGVCIVYTHFAYHFVDAGGQLNSVTRERLKDLASRNGYFVPVSKMLDFLRTRKKSDGKIPWTEQAYLQIRWIFEKIFIGYH